MGRALAALCVALRRSAGSIKQQHKKGAADSRGRRSVVQNFINCGQRFGIGSDDLRRDGLSMWLYPIAAAAGRTPSEGSPLPSSCRLT